MNYEKKTYLKSLRKFRDCLGSDQGLLGPLGELAGSSKITLEAVWGARSLRDRLQAPQNELVASFFADLGNRKQFKIGIGASIFRMLFGNRILREKRNASGVFLMNFGELKWRCKMVWIRRHSFGA